MKPCSASSSQSPAALRSKLPHPTTIQNPSTTGRRDGLMKSRTRASAVLAGLSPPSRLSSPSGQRSRANFFHSLSLTLSTALILAMHAMAV